MEKKYIRTFLLIFGGLLLSTVSFNYLVDPFYIFSSPRIKNFNFYKPASDTRQRLSKAYQIIKLKPKTVIVGTSRALQISQDSPAFQHQPVMNYALASSTTYETYRYLQHANYHSQLKQIVYGLDFFSFSSSPNKQYYKDHRLSVLENNAPSPNKLASYLSDVVPSLFTLSALKASLRTVAKQGAGDLNAIWNKPRRVQRISERNGHLHMFSDLEKSILASHKKLKVTTSCPTPRRYKTNIGGYKYFRKILNFSYENNIDLKLFISPQHIRFNEMYYMTGKWRTFENWKRDIVIINKKAATLAGKEPFKIWDFSGYNAYTTERVPTDRTAVMNWYWEGSHYTTELANIMLDIMLDDEGQKKYPHFGRTINASNIEHELAGICLEREAYKKKNPAFFHDYHKFIKKIFIQKSR